MTFGQFLSVMRARWWVVLGVLAVTVGATVAISWSMPRQYTASTSFLLDIKPDPVSAVVYGGLPSPAFMSTQVDIIKSDSVGLRVARNTKLGENPQVRQQWLEASEGQGSIEQWLVDLFRRQLEVLPSRESNVITVSYKAPDPRSAAAMANAFVEAYMQISLELRVDPARQYSSFFDTRAKEAREALEKAQNRLSEFQKEKGITSAEERLDIENARLNELSSQLVSLQAVAAESSSRQAQAISTQGDRLPEVLNNAVVSGLKADIGRAEARLRELLMRLGDNHPQVQEARASLSELRASLDVETRRVTGGVGVGNTINRQREAQLRAELETQRANVLRLKAVRDEASVLTRDIENARRTYDAIVARFTQTSLESQTTQSNISVISQAVPPRAPSSPKMLLNALVATFAGTLLGVGLALLLEWLDRRVRSTEDVAATLGLPVLGVMPRPGSRLLGGPRPSVLQRRLMAPLPPPGKGA
jgi:chain length determinant protein EpsF